MNDRERAEGVDWDAVDWTATNVAIAETVGVHRRYVAQERSRRGAAPAAREPSTKPPRREITEADWRWAGLGALPDREVAEMLKTAPLRVATERRKRRMGDPEKLPAAHVLPRLEVTRLPPGFRFDLAWLARQTSRQEARIWKDREAFLDLVDEVVGPHGVWVRR